MIYRFEKILADARVAMQMNPKREKPLFADCEQLSLDDYIRSRVLPAVEHVHRQAPMELLELGHNITGAPFWADGDNWGWVLLPPDFMRLVVFEMDDWQRPVFTALSPTSWEYEVQKRRIEGLRGNPERPVCFLTHRQEGLALEFYGCASRRAQVRRGVYVPYPQWDADGVDISERCYPAVIEAIISPPALSPPALSPPAP